MKQIHECLNEKQIRKGMIVLPLRRTDYDAVCDMDKISGFGLKQCVKDLHGYNDYSWELYLFDELIGYCTIGGADDVYYAIEECPLYTPEAYLLSDIFIRPEYRHHNYGIQMIKQVIAKRIAADSLFNDEKYPVFLESISENLVPYYKKAGFSSISNDELCMILLP